MDAADDQLTAELPRHLALNVLPDRTVTRAQSRKYGEYGMLKFIGGTAGVIFIIGLIVVIGIFKLLF